MKQGFWPDSISTDLHSGSVNGAMIDMLNVMSKFLALGVPLKEVIRESTTNPATEIRRPQLGQIAVGADADVAVLRLDHGKFGFVDARGGRIEGKERLGCEMTVRAGKIVFDFNGRAGLPWRDGAASAPRLSGSSRRAGAFHDLVHSAGDYLFVARLMHEKDEHKSRSRRSIGDAGIAFQQFRFTAS